MRRAYRKVIGLLLAMSMLISLMPTGVMAGEQMTVSSQDVVSDIEEIADVIPDAIPEETEEAVSAPESYEISAGVTEDIAEEADEPAVADQVSENVISGNKLPVIIGEGAEPEFTAETLSGNMQKIGVGSEYIGDYEYYSVKAGDYIVTDVSDESPKEISFKLNKKEGFLPKVSKLEYNEGSPEDDPSWKKYVWEEVESNEYSEENGGYYDYSFEICYGAVRIEQLPKVKVTFNTIDCSVVSVLDKEGNPLVGTEEDTPVTSCSVRKGDPIRLDVECIDDYKVESCMVGDKDVPYDDEYCTYDFKVNEDCTVTIMAVPDDRTVHFNANASDWSISVETNDYVTQDEYDENTYHVSYKASDISFDIEPGEDNYSEPVVYYESIDSAPQESVGNSVDNVYTYCIDRLDLPVETDVVVLKREEISSNKVTFTYPETDDAKYLKDVVLSYEDTVCTPEVTRDTVKGTVTKSYTIPYGKSLTLEAFMKDHYAVGALMVKKNGRTTVYRLGAESIKRRIAVMGDVEITLYPVEKLWIRVSKKGLSENQITGITNNSGTIVTYELENGEYIGEVMLGNKKAPASVYTLKDKVRDPDTYTDGTFEFNVNNSVRPGNKVRSYHVRSKKGLETVKVGDYCQVAGFINHAIRIKPVPTVRSLTVRAKGLKQGSCSTLADSRTIFNLKATENINGRGKTASLSNVDLEVTFGGETESVPKNEWYDVKDSADNVIASIKYDVSKRRVEFVSGVYERDLSLSFKYGSEILSTVAVSVKKDSKITSMEPAVKVTDTSDQNICLQFSDIDIAVPYKGKTYYKVVATPAEGARPANLTSGRTWYIERTYPELLDYPEPLGYPDDATDAQIAAIDRKNDAATNAVDQKNEAITKAFRQSAVLSMVEDTDNEGANWKYDLRVSCVTSYPGMILDPTDEYVAKKEFLKGKEKNIEASTKDPVYATKVTLSKKKTAFYAGEKNVNVAVVNFDKNASCTSLDVEDITADLCDEGRLQVTYDPATRKLIASSTWETTAGKHVIKVTPEGRGIYQAGTTITVNVYESIYSIEVVPASREYNKADNDKLSFKTSVIYNDDSNRPKTKKVKYSIVPEGIEEDEELPCKVSVDKKGKVTVDKYIPEEEDAVCPEFSFRVKAEACDYAGNQTFGLSAPIRISHESRKIGTAMLLVENEEETEYTVIAAGDTDTATKLTTDKVNSALFAVAEPGAPVKEKYTSYEFERFFLDRGLYTFSTSNKKALDSYLLGNKKIWVYSGKFANNIKLSAMTKDGGKNSSSLKVSVVMDKPEALELMIDGCQTGETSVTISGNSNTPVSLEVLKKDKASDTNWNNLTGKTNYSLSVKGGRFVSKNTDEGKYEVCVAADKAILTLKNKTDNVKKIYTITNAAYNNYKSNSITAKALNSLICYKSEDQTLNFSVSSKRYDLTGKYLMIKPDIVGYNNNGNYECLFEAVGSDGSTGIFVPITDVNRGAGKASVSLNCADVDPSKYKLNVCCVEKTGVDEDGDPVYSLPVTKPFNVVVKCVKPRKKKGSFKPAKSFTMNSVSPNTITLTNTGRELKYVDYQFAYNNNVKGRPNKFLDYFEFNQTDTSDEENPIYGTIRLRDDVLTDPAKLAYIKSKQGAVDRTCYITYDASYGDNGYGSPLTYVTKTVKVTIVFK